MAEKDWCSHGVAAMASLTVSQGSVTGEIDWCAHVVAAMGDERTKPQPGNPLLALEHWSHEFERVEGGPPMEADYPETVRAFFRWLSQSFGRRQGGRPCGDEKLIFAAKAAWVAASLGRTYAEMKGLIAVSKKFGIDYRPDPDGLPVFVDKGVEPGAAALAVIGEDAGLSANRVRNIISTK